jgi:hypothetical protein
VTEYQVFESVDNNTGADWSSYKMYLGYGVGAAFVLSGLGDDLDFDTPDNDLPPTSSALPLVARPDEDSLVFSGGIHGSGAESYRFRVDVPDVPTFPHFSKFTLRQIPCPVPEPCTLTLAGLVLAGLAWHRRRS